MTKRLYVLLGQSNDLGTGVAADMTVWPGGVTAPYSNVVYLEHSANGADPPSFADSNGGVAYALQPRTSTIVGQVAGTCGVELTLGRQLDTVLTGNVVLLKIAIDGSGLQNKWLPTTSPVFPTGGPQWYSTMVAYILAAQTTLGAILSGIVWIQGGTDANEVPDAANYGPNMTTFFTAFRSTFGPIPIVFDRLHINAGVSDAASVRAGQATFAAATSLVAMIDADDLTLVSPSFVHYDTNSLGTLGVRMADAFLAMMESNDEPFDIDIGGSGGGSPVFPVLSIATTAESIRDRAIAVIGALTPGHLFGARYAKYRNEGKGDFVEWALANPAAALRRFQVRTTDDEPPGTSNTDYEERRVKLTITVAYPANARTGPDQALDRDDIITEDYKQLDFAVGVYGRANFSPPNPDAMPLGFSPQNIVRGGAVDFLVIEEWLTYQRLTS
jgi:hypothetical protein